MIDEDLNILIEVSCTKTEHIIGYTSIHDHCLIILEYKKN